MSSKKIFIDASVLYSFIDRADPNHIQSAKTLELLSLQGVTLFTSLHSIQDTYAAINRHMGQTVAMDFLQAMTESSIEVLYPQKADFNAAVKLITLNRNKQISFKEALTAILMQKRSTSQIFTFNFWPNLLGSQSFLAIR